MSLARVDWAAGDGLDVDPLPCMGPEEDAAAVVVLESAIVGKLYA